MAWSSSNAAEFWGEELYNSLSADLPKAALEGYWLGSTDGWGFGRKILILDNADQVG